MSCANFEELISAVLDGECTAEERRTLEEHLAVCPRCKERFEQLAAQSAALRSLDIEVPEHLKANIMANLPPRKGKVVPFRRWAAVAVAACLVVVIGVVAAPNLSHKDTARMKSAAPMNSAMAPVLPVAAEPAAAMEAPMEIMEDTSNYVVYEAEVLPENDAACSFRKAQVQRIFISEDLPTEGFIFHDYGSLKEFVRELPEAECLIDTYGEGYFSDGAALLVVTRTEPSGSNQLEITGLAPNAVTVTCAKPMTYTSDMAHWLLTAEVDGSEFAGMDHIDVVIEQIDIVEFPIEG